MAGPAELVEVLRREPVEDAQPAGRAELGAVGEEERVGVRGDRREVNAGCRAEREAWEPRLAGRWEAGRLALHTQHVGLDARRAVVARHLDDVFAGAAVGDGYDGLVLGGSERRDAEHRTIRPTSRSSSVSAESASLRCVIERPSRPTPESRAAPRYRVGRAASCPAARRRPGRSPWEMAEPDRRPCARGRHVYLEEVGVRRARQVREVERARRERTERSLFGSNVSCTSTESAPPSRPCPGQSRQRAKPLPGPA